ATMMEGTVYRRLTPHNSDPQHLQEISQAIVSMLINK
ncbi:TetR/AcrR family transcriptional regulator, partial [Escherichia coli]|nr:TetR/AcrR family transcriptional regulator [Escherichia coli]